MIRKPMIAMFTFFFLLGSVCSSFGAQNETGRVTLSDSNFQDGSTLLKPEAAKVPAVFFPETSYTFDPVVDGVYVTHDFVVHNKGDGLLKINRVRTG